MTSAIWYSLEKRPASDWLMATNLSWDGFSSESRHASPWARSSAAERSAHNRLVTGSNPVEPTIKAKFLEYASGSFKKSHVWPEASELLQPRELLFILLGNKGGWLLELRQKTNDELFTLYEGELTFHHRSARRIHEAKRALTHFCNYIGEFPPTPELAKSFLSAFKDHKPMV